MTSSGDLQALVQAAEVVLAMTDWDRWNKAGMEKGRAWCVARALVGIGLSDCSTHALPLHGFDSAVCWEMLAALTESGMLEEAAAFLQVRASPAALDLTACPSTVTLKTDAFMIFVMMQNRPMHLPLLVSVVGLSLRPVFLGIPRTAEVDQSRIRFCTSVACVPKLVESVPSAMVSMFRRPRLWRTLLPVLANVASTSGLPVVGCVPRHLVSDLVPTSIVLSPC